MPEWLPLESLFEYGADDRVFDWLIVYGVAQVVLIALVGRTLPTELLAGAYVCTFLLTLLYRGY
ncbi:MAG: hypothetical protein ABEI96_03895 [Haloarculaceae archaeon]